MNDTLGTRSERQSDLEMINVLHSRTKICQKIHNSRNSPSTKIYIYKSFNNQSDISTKCKTKLDTTPLLLKYLELQYNDFYLSIPSVIY